MAFRKHTVYMFLLFSTCSLSLKRQRSVLSVRKQLEYLESLIHTNTFSPREDLFDLQEQINASLLAQTNIADQGYAATCRKQEISEIKDDMGILGETLKTLAHGFGEEKKISLVSRKAQKEENEVAVELFNSKFTQLEQRILNMENDIDSFKREINRTMMDQQKTDKLSPGDCPLNGITWKSSCYVLNVVVMNWTDTVNECKARGGQLAKLETEEEMRFVLPKLGQNTWVGGHDVEVEGQWRWIGEEKEIEFLLWEPGQPNGTGDCLEAYNGMLNDERCSVMNKFVCEYSL